MSADGESKPSLDKSFSGNTLKIKGTEYQHGIGTCAPSEIIFSLDGTVKRFSCLAGPDAGGGETDTVVFKVYGDGKKLFESPVMKAGSDAIPIDLNVSGVEQLHLHAVYGGDSREQGHADWVNVKFE